MRTTESISELRVIRASMHGAFGVVPTMGALHEGHGSLIKKARIECNYVGASIFVNPAQFSAGEDFGNYPRTLQRDLDLFESWGVDVVFMPTVESMYASGYQTWIDVENVSVPLEGEFRPGHFRGVATVVAKLFNLFTPSRAYFGQKDAQQVAVLQRMVHDLNFPVEIVVCPTIRESDGLAMSSRNAYLNPEERRAAPVIYRALCAAKSRYESGERDAEALRAVMRSVLQSEPLANPQYVSAADPATLSELEKIEKGVLFSLAVRIGKARLIDNILL